MVGEGNGEIAIIKKNIWMNEENTAMKPIIMSN